MGTSLRESGGGKASEGDGERPPGSAPALAGVDRRHLRRLAHDLKPIVQVGSAGITDAVQQALGTALRDHELVKLRLAGEREQRQAMAAELAARTGSALAGLVGQVAILYRPARDPERRRIALPSAGPSVGRGGRGARGGRGGRAGRD